MSFQQYFFKSQLASVAATAEAIIDDTPSSNTAAKYNNGPTNNGVGATLTGNFPTLTVDGVVLKNGDRVAVLAQGPTQNGIYVASGIGDSWLLTRAEDNHHAEQIKSGQFFYTRDGANKGVVFTVLDPVPAVVGIDPLSILAKGHVQDSDISAFTVPVDFSQLAAGGQAVLFNVTGSSSYRITDLWINKSNPPFAFGDRSLEITDLTTQYSLIDPPDVSVMNNNGWGDSNVQLPYPPTLPKSTPTAPGANLIARWTGGTLDYTNGATIISGLMTKIS